MNENLNSAGINQTSEAKISAEMFDILKSSLDKWYPLVIDKKYGGYFTNLSYNWEIETDQPKMIVTQARHIWTASKAAAFFDNNIYKKSAEHGLKFLNEKMWDNEFGGFYQIRNREGNLSEVEGWFNEKRMYGNAFAIYGLAALYDLTKNKNALKLAQNTFYWIEEHTFDQQLNGYFQFFTREGKIFNKDSSYRTKATDAIEVGFKDQNSSIHLLEAYTELFNIWKDELLHKKLNDLLVLICDVITTEKGYLQLFFEPDWKPVSFRNSNKEEREANFRLDHVSFGHNYETAFLMLEASHILGIKNDIKTLTIAKKMVDHAIEYGWDKINGGFFDEGYYFDDSECKIIKDTKVWWAQAEGLNILLLFSQIFLEEKKYYELFLQLWEYVKKYLIDDEYGDWYWGSLEKEPYFKKEQKSNIWKGTYHTGRALMNCIKILADDDFELAKKSEGFRREKNNMDEMIKHWKETGEKL